VTNSSSQDIARKLLLALIRDPLEIEQVDDCLQAGPDWEELATQALRHEVFPLVYQGLKPVSDRVPTEFLIRYQNLHAQNTLRNLQMQKELRRLTHLLLGSGIPIIPFKGPVLAESAYGDLALRSFKDLDILVPSGRAWQALLLIKAEGYTLDFDLTEKRWPSLQRTINHLFLVHPGLSIVVELHWQAFHPMYVLPFDLSEHWSFLQGVEGPREGRLEPEENLVLHCAHGTKHVWDSLKWMVDTQRMLAANPWLDWQKTFALAETCGSRRALLLGLELAGRVGGMALPHEVVQKLEEDPMVKRLADDVWDHLFPDAPLQRQFLREYLFYLRSRERFTDRWRQIVRWLFCPRQADWLVFPLGGVFYPLFYVERPVRMITKWLVVPLFCRVRRLTGKD
jgi:hypothetical protein